MEWGIHNWSVFLGSGHMVHSHYFRFFEESFPHNFHYFITMRTLDFNLDTFSGKSMAPQEFKIALESDENLLSTLYHDLLHSNNHQESLFETFPMTLFLPNFLARPAQNHPMGLLCWKCHLRPAKTCETLAQKFQGNSGKPNLGAIGK
jgi:hypothetical protein